MSSRPAFTADNGASVINYQCLTNTKANTRRWIKVGMDFFGFCLEPSVVLLEIR